MGKAVVNGGSNGMGRAFSERLILEGYHMVILGRNKRDQSLDM